jgi:cell wall-associated NlpC family hydrolase
MIQIGVSRLKTFQQPNFSPKGSTENSWYGERILHHLKNLTVRSLLLWPLLLIAFLIPIATPLAYAGTIKHYSANATPTNSGVTATKNKILQAQKKLSSIEKSISQDSTVLQIASERYDTTVAALSIASKQLHASSLALVKEERKTAAAKITVRNAAVEAYVEQDISAAQFAAILTGSLDNMGSIETYTNLATDTLSQAVRALQNDETSLCKAVVTEKKSVTADRIAAKNAGTAKLQAENASKAATLALSKVKGHIADLIAQQVAQEAAIAAAKARAEELAAKRAEALAKKEARIRERRQKAEARLLAEEETKQASNDNAQAASQLAAAQGYANIAQQVDSASPNPTTLAYATSAEQAANAVASLGEPPLTLAGTNSAGNIAVATAESFLGVPYVWGGASRSGLDCSGLTMLSWQAAGIPLLHSAWYQYLASKPVQLNNLEPGDLLFYYFPHDGTTDPVSHVAMYVGSGPYGTQTIIQAPEPGMTVSYAPMYYVGFVGAGQP